MPAGQSLHIGLDYVDKTHYGNECRLPFCSKDAAAMQQLALSRGYATSILTNTQATSGEVISRITKAAAILQPGDIFLLTFSGHGAPLQDLNGDEEEGFDETWVLYNRMLVDDELAELWCRFKKGVRIVVVSDSCHSGTVIKNDDLLLPESLPNRKEQIKYLMKKTNNIYKSHRAVYDAALLHLPPRAQRETLATVILLSACRDNQRASGRYKTLQHSLFTYKLLEAWQNGQYKGGYSSFIGQVSEEVKNIYRCQVPGMYVVSSNPNHEFITQTPFTI